jgi:predicted transcriptional regulator
MLTITIIVIILDLLSQSLSLATRILCVVLNQIGANWLLQGNEIMAKAIVRTSTEQGFFSRARQAAKRADAGQVFERKITLSFEDPNDLLAVISAARQKLILAVVKNEKSISQLVDILQRDRVAITKDICALERAGLLVSQRRPNPGHGIQKYVRTTAPRIELITVIS